MKITPQYVWIEPCQGPPQKLYKLTDRYGFTRNDTEWKIGVTNHADDFYRIGPMCTNAWIHAYKDPDIAMLCIPVHVPHYQNGCRLWEAEGVVRISDEVKCGVKSLTLTKEIPTLPLWTPHQRMLLTCFIVAHVNNIHRHAEACEWLKKHYPKAADWVDEIKPFHPGISDFIQMELRDMAVTPSHPHSYRCVQDGCGSILAAITCYYSLEQLRFRECVEAANKAFYGEL